MHLEMKSSCEKCTTPLAGDAEAYICSFECTFCPTCASSFQNFCPNCGGELVLRPRRNICAEAERTFEVGLPSDRPALLWAISFGAWAFISLAATATIYEMYHLGKGGAPFGTIAGMQFSSLFTYAPLTPLAFAFAVRYPVQRGNWVRRSLLHLAAALVFTLGHIALKAATPYGYWDPAYREWSSAIWNSHAHALRDPWIVLKSMYLASVVDDAASAYLPIVFIAHAVSYYRRFRERELRATQLEGQLAKARLQTLKSQLQPHFLFNTLHSISALMLIDVYAADRMMTRLSDLLRLSLESGGSQLTTLSQELEFLNGYLEIEKTRFEDRLTVVFEIAPDCLDAQVPHLLLQPLVENAVRHGISRMSAGGEIRIEGRHDGANLLLRVKDNGPGLASSSNEQFKSGVGLTVTRERLITLFGDDQSCRIRNLPEGGVEVCLQIPFFVGQEPSEHEAVTLRQD